MSGSYEGLRLDRREDFPPELLAISSPREVRRAFPNPTLITIKGRREPPLFVCVLQHGNETSSFYVLQDIARAVQEAPPARSLMVFVAGVHAAEAGVRFLPGAADFNRVWAGGEGPEAAIAAEVVAAARAAQPFASIDIHNTTGINPPYACVARLEPAHMGLATLFSRIVVHYVNPPTTQAVNFSKFCTATTIECGRSDNVQGRERASQLVFDVMRAEALAPLAPHPGDAEIYHTAGRVLLAPGARFAFGAPEEVEFAADFDRLNFTELERGEVFARLHGERSPVIVIDDSARDVTDQFFVRDGDYLRLTRRATPAMLTTDAKIVRQDCVGYLMERVGARDAA